MSHDDAAAALADGGPRGVRWTPTTSVDDWAPAAAAAGRRCWCVNTATVRDKAGFLAACEEAFALPAWFGRNWDALEESLRDLDVAPGAVVVWSGWQPWRDADPAGFDVAVDVLRAVARSWRDDGRAGLVVLVGDGPDPGVPRWPAR